MIMRLLFGAVVALALSATVLGSGLRTVEISGVVAGSDLSRGPFQDATAGDPVSITYAIDTSMDLGGGDIHIYETIGYEIKVGKVTMTASAVPVFVFSTFVSFHGFENTSTGFLLPGGGNDHNYRLPVFGASGPPTFWLPQGSEPQDHPGVYPVCLFDFLNTNTVEDTFPGGGKTERLIIDLTSITLDPVQNATECIGDLTRDGAVDAADLAQLLDSWGDCTGACTPDLDGDCTVGPADLAQLLDAWGPCS